MRTAKFALEDLSEVWAFLDPAGKKDAAARQQGCRPSVNVVAPDALGRVFWLYSWAKKMDTRSVIHHLMDVSDFWHPQVFGCEANAMQSLFADAVDIIAEEKKRDLRLTGIRQPTQIDKDFRIRSIMHPVVGVGKLMVLERLPGCKWHPLIGVPQDCLIEVTAFPMHPLRDVVDGLASAVALIPPRRAATLEKSRAAASRYEREMSQLYGNGEVESYEGEGDPFKEFRP